MPARPAISANGAVVLPGFDDAQIFAGNDARILGLAA